MRLALSSVPRLVPVEQLAKLTAGRGSCGMSHKVLYNFAVNARAKVCLAAILLLSLGMLARAQSVSQLRPTGYVNDYANVLDPATKARIENIFQQVDQKAKAQITLVTIKTLDGSDIESVAVDLFHKWGVGYKGTDRGVLILYVIQDRRARVEVGYGLEPILPDGRVGGFQREAIPLMQSGNYNQALLLVSSRIADVIASDAGVQLTNTVPRPPARPVQQPSSGIGLGGIVILIIIFLIILFTPLRSLLFWLLFSGMFGGRGGGFGGGGYGGFGGGGGWGGGGGGGCGGVGFCGGWGGGSSCGGGARSSG